MSAGYSGTPLARKLGFLPGWRIGVVDAPDSLPGLLGELPEGAELIAGVGPALDAVWLFAVSRASLEQRLPAALACLRDSGMLWISWPKRSSGVASDVTESVLREVVLPTGWVDIKVAAVDATWSALRFALRRELRG